MSEGIRTPFLLELLTYGASGMLGAASRLAKSRRGRVVTMRVLLLETPGAIACGMIGAAAAKWAGATDPTAIAAAAAAAGHVGMTALVGLLMTYLPRKPPRPDPRKDRT